ncbi:hypothetical protein QBC34DRAFT_454721 [Podospora aff. communis PSN243]|uniref:Uncharacterized protein n=1 Tax=Podospora aff. communis PSN243 TaxID=3040156 RepID=A0AAV9G5Q1_9PEZI|nr:hypothetical protein QBC34DRAFT_454721 [Podospora aff. communis PSN243]
MTDYVDGLVVGKPALEDRETFLSQALERAKSDGNLPVGPSWNDLQIRHYDTLQSLYIKQGRIEEAEESSGTDTDFSRPRLLKFRHLMLKARMKQSSGKLVEAKILYLQAFEMALDENRLDFTEEHWVQLVLRSLRNVTVKLGQTAEAQRFEGIGHERIRRLLANPPEGNHPGLSDSAGCVTQEPSSQTHSLESCPQEDYAIQEYDYDIPEHDPIHEHPIHGRLLRSLISARAGAIPWQFSRHLVVSTLSLSNPESYGSSSHRGFDMGAEVTALGGNKLSQQLNAEGLSGYETGYDEPVTQKFSRHDKHSTQPDLNDIGTPRDRRGNIIGSAEPEVERREGKKAEKVGADNRVKRSKHKKRFPRSHEERSRIEVFPVDPFFSIPERRRQMPDPENPEFDDYKDVRYIPR